MIIFLLIYFVGVTLCGLGMMIYAIEYARRKGVPEEEQHRINWEECYKFGLGDAYPNMGTFAKRVCDVISIILMPLETFKWAYNMIKEADRFAEKHEEEA